MPRTRCHRLRISLLALVCAATPQLLHGQSTSDPDTDVCFGLSFGTWSPPLEWRAAGHAPLPEGRVSQQAPSGRDWAADLPTSTQGARDSTLVLFPVWWPAGVAIVLPTRRLVDGDTLVGQATALVADARIRPPKANVRAWRVPCRRSEPAPAPSIPPSTQPPKPPDTLPPP